MFISSACPEETNQRRGHQGGEQRLCAAGGRRSKGAVSAAAPLAGRGEAGPGTAIAARREISISSRLAREDDVHFFCLSRRNEPKKKTLRRGRFRFLPLLRTSLIETTKRDPAGSPVGFPPGTRGKGRGTNSPSSAPFGGTFPRWGKAKDGEGPHQSPKATAVRLAVPENPFGLALILRIFDRCGKTAPPYSATGSGGAVFPVRGEGKGTGGGEAKGASGRLIAAPTGGRGPHLNARRREKRRPGAAEVSRLPGARSDHPTRSIVPPPRTRSPS